MNVFYGGDNYSLSYPVNNAPGWMPANTSAYVKPVQRTYNNHTYYGYEVATDKTKWVNAANTLTPGPPLINMSVFLPDLFSNANTQIFLVLKDSRSISKLSGDPGSRKFIAANIPAGKAATLVCFAKCANNYFLAAKDISTGDGMTELKPMPSDLSKIISYLNSL
jgi:hypothetical protein